MLFEIVTRLILSQSITVTHSQHATARYLITNPLKGNEDKNNKLFLTDLQFLTIHEPSNSFQSFVFHFYLKEIK